MSDQPDEVCLRQLARAVARSQIRYSALTRQDPPPPQALINMETELLKRRRRQLKERVERGRKRGDLPMRYELFSEIILIKDEDCDQDSAEAGVAAALILEVLDAG